MRAAAAANMARRAGGEQELRADELIVSKTDLKGRITYANAAFARISGYTVEELTGKPHSIVRHPAMPRGVFRLVWDELEAKREVWAHVMNRTRTGDRYWVVACLTPTYGADGTVVGYHSTRRAPSRQALPVVADLYRTMLDLEAGITDPRKAAVKSRDWLNAELARRDTTLTRLVFELERPRRAA